MIIALLTDFGTKDYFAGALKGAILSINENAKIVDITHEIPPQNIESAAFTLRACYENFPAKTIFVAVVDPGVGSARKAILVETEKYFFIAPDNGLLSFIFDKNTSEKKRKGEEELRKNLRDIQPSPFLAVYELTNEKFFAEKISRTFHGRDVFAPVAAHLANGVKPKEFGRKVENFVCFETTAPRKISDDKIEAEIIHIDIFGNLITNLRREDLPGKFLIEINGKLIDKMQNIYAEATGEELFMLFGSAGFLEIAAMQNSASKLLNAKNGAKVLVSILMPKKSA